MIKKISVVVFVIVISACSKSTDHLYFGQTPPGDSAILFAPSFISLPDRWEPCITFSKDLHTACFYIEHWPKRDTNYILITSYQDGVWSVPQKATFAHKRYTGEPFFSPIDNDVLYLYSNHSDNQVGELDLSFVSRKDFEWNEPRSLGAPPNMHKGQFHPCVVEDGSLYYATDKEGDICRSQFKDGKYMKPVRLPYPINGANTDRTWGDPFVSPDESYLIFKSTRKGGLGQNDIYISYKKVDGGWTNPKNLGPKINTSYDESAGDITPDGKYMTFCSNKDLYWISSSFIDRFRSTNFTPYLNDSIDSITCKKGDDFKYKFKDNVFIDDDGNETLSYTLTMEGSTVLPEWLHFSAQNNSIQGKTDLAGSYHLSLKAQDSAGDSAVCKFRLIVE
ncbi:putative Ig domain-containing protein [Labilibacter marinus]|uniref:putative Ig domain-containing protein n=1 Tax=Labilibacter marinus TaxID=1477105 RepID=UPI00082C2DE6|nr:putative Ig domain-containing protein [Labilibacter marinus]